MSGRAAAVDDMAAVLASRSRAAAREAVAGPVQARRPPGLTTSPRPQGISHRAILQPCRVQDGAFCHFCCHSYGVVGAEAVGAASGLAVSLASSSSSASWPSWGEYYYEIWPRPGAIGRNFPPSTPLGGDRYAVVKCQLALLSTARSLQRELQTYANAAITDTMAGLAAGLQDAAMALMRHSQYWRYGAVQVQHAATLDDAERAFNRVVSQERAKLSAELTVNIDGVRRQPSAPENAASGEVGQYLVVTLIVATGYPDFTTYQTPSLKDLEATLQRLGNLLTSDLLALEVIWSPENPDDALTEDELIAEYPELSGL